MLSPTQEQTVAEALDTESGTHTAVVYVHGMGDQRRYEELSRLIDSLERHARVNEATTGRLDLIQPKLEPARGELKGEVAYVEVLRQRRLTDTLDQSLFRFYEVYWAPIAAGGTTTREVIVWLASQGLYPIKTLRSPWRDRARLRRAALHELWAARGNDTTYEPQDRDRLLKLYDQFDGPAARLSYPKGNFSQFRTFISEVARREPRSAQLDKLARAWRRHYGRSELRNLFVVVSVLLTMLLALGAVLAGVTYVLAKLSSFGAFQNTMTSLGLPEDAGGFKVSALITGGVLTLFGFTRFLLNYMGDVQLWTTYEETNTKCQKRAAILETTVQHLRHVLLDPQCNRVAVVSHSLGTTIALDSLLALARSNRAFTPGNPVGPPTKTEHFTPTAFDRLLELAPDEPMGLLSKIEHFITIASPIDKVYYFFESYKGGRYRYNQIVEDIRGDLGSSPFARTANDDIIPHVHWINFWDKADIIGGSVESPSSRRRGDLRVDNIEVANLRFPNPGASHSAYFDHKAVIREVFEAIFNRKGSMVMPPLAKPYTEQAERRFLGPGSGMRHTRWIQGVYLFVPWLIVVTVIVNKTAGESTIRQPLIWTSVVAVGLALAGFVLGKWLGRVEKLS
jgi:hypothetical protein